MLHGEFIIHLSLFFGMHLIGKPLFLWHRDVGTEVRGGDRVKHKELLGKSWSQFIFNERAERTESRHSPTKLAKMWSTYETCGGNGPCHLEVYKGTYTKQQILVK